MAAIDQPVWQLSGGNQQRVVLARWMLARSKVLLLDEPSRGIDVRARVEVHKLLRELCRPPRAELVVSSDIDELLRLCDVVSVMVSGKLVDCRPVGQWSRESLLAAALGRAA